MMEISELFGSEGGAVAAGAVTAITGAALFLNRFIGQFKQQSVENSKISAEGDIVEMLRTQLKELAETNEKLRTEIERLHEEVHKLRIENMELGLKIKGLSNNENIG